MCLSTLGISGTPAGNTTEKITEGTGRDYPAKSSPTVNPPEGGGFVIVDGLGCDTDEAFHAL